MIFTSAPSTRLPAEARQRSLLARRPASMQEAKSFSFLLSAVFSPSLRKYLSECSVASVMYSVPWGPFSRPPTLHFVAFFPVLRIQVCWHASGRCCICTSANRPLQDSYKLPQAPKRERTGRQSEGGKDGRAGLAVEVQAQRVHAMYIPKRRRKEVPTEEEKKWWLANVPCFREPGPKALWHNTTICILSVRCESDRISISWPSSQSSPDPGLRGLGWKR